MTVEETDLEQYIVIHYHHLLTLEEKLAYKHHLTTEKAENSNEDFGKMLMSRWGTTNKEALKLLEGGYNDFKKNRFIHNMDPSPVNSINIETIHIYCY